MFRIGLLTTGKTLDMSLFKSYQKAGITDMEISTKQEDYPFLDFDANHLLSGITQAEFIRHFGDKEQIKENLSVLLEELRNSPKAEIAERIYTHGEKEHFAYIERMKNGIEIDIKTVSEMLDLCSYLGMDTEAYLGREASSIPRQKSNYEI